MIMKTHRHDAHPTPRYFVIIDWLRHDKKYAEATRHYFRRLDEIHQEQS